MNALQIHLFGGLDVARGDRRIPPFATQKARALFAYLVLNRSRAHTRDSLVGVFWGERPEPVAKKCLRTDIWRVRHAFSEDAEEVLLLKDHKIAFNSALPHWIDVAEFEALLGKVRPVEPERMLPEEAAALEAAVDLYRGDLLEGVYEDDWFLYERERMRLLYLTALERLMRYRQGREEWGAAAAIGQRLLAADPLREHVHRELIRCYYRQGNRPAALRQYAQCESVLRAELDIEPMTETRRLLDEIRNGGTGLRITISPVTSPPSEISQWKAALDSASRSLEAVSRQLEELRKTIEAAEARGGRVL